MVGREVAAVVHDTETHTSEPINQSINQFITRSIKQSINQFITRLINQSIEQSSDQAIKQLAKQAINQSIKRWIESIRYGIWHYNKSLYGYTYYAPQVYQHDRAWSQKRSACQKIYTQENGMRQSKDNIGKITTCICYIPIVVGKKAPSKTQIIAIDLQWKMTMWWEKWSKPSGSAVLSRYVESLFAFTRELYP